MNGFKQIDGGVTAPKGFRASGVHAGIKAAKPDMALVVSDMPAAVAGTFTTNKVQAAPVVLCRQRLAGGTARAVVFNSGCANACTGEPGMTDALRMGAVTARALDADESTVFVCSTGTIGTRLPMTRIEAGVQAAAAALSPEGGPDAAEAIMTTDTVSKQAAVELPTGNGTVRIGGMAKGAGMIDPNMATMLCMVTTDAAVAGEHLQQCVSAAVDASFNKITVDGDQSTNDTVLVLANGAAGTPPLTPQDEGWQAFTEAVVFVMTQLATAIVRDGEGATRFVTVTVRGAAGDEDAGCAARSVANSLLCKTSWFGGDPNWGRVIAAVGYAGVEFDADRVDIAFDDVPAVRAGMLAEGVELSALEEVYAKPSFTITIDLHAGTGADTVYTCDCSYDYVKINAEYMT